MTTADMPADTASVAHQGISWIQLIAPDQQAITALEHELGVPSALIHHALDQGELARLEKAQGALLVVLRVPYLQGDAESMPYLTVPLGIILTHRAVVTVCSTQTGIVPETDELYPASTVEEQRSRFVLLVLQKTAETYLRYLRDIEERVDATELHLQRSLRNSEVLELLRYQKGLTHFTTGLKLNALLLERLQDEPLVHLEIEDALLENVLVEMRQAYEMTQIASDILSQMMDAFASIISNNLNVVMKFLTAFTIVLTFPTMVASFYGMNIALPWQHSANAFLLTVVVSLVLSVCAAVVFWRKGWL